MPDISNEKKRDIDKQVLTTLRAKADGDGFSRVRMKSFSHELDLSYSAVKSSMGRLSSRGLIEVEAAGDKRTDGLLVAVDMGSAARKDQTEVVVPVVAAPRPLRKCPKCGTLASNEQAAYCWRCGQQLKSKDEMLQDGFRKVIARLPQMYPSAKTEVLDEDLAALWAVYERAFGKRR